MSPTPNDNETSRFPYKSLIWGVIVLIALFLFKMELKDLITRADEISMFGVEVKVGKEKAAQLERAIKKYENEISLFSEEVAEQQARIDTLESLKTSFENDLANCPSAAESSRKLNLAVDRVFKASSKIEAQSKAIRNVRIKDASRLIQSILPPKQ